MANQKKSKEEALKDYVTVPERVAEFREKYPDGIINTEIVKWENGVVIMKATVYRNPEEFQKGIFLAVGHAYEKEGSNFINDGNALENCETSAVGRALGFLGLGIKKAIASREEVENAVKRQEEKRKQTEPAPDRKELLNEMKNNVYQLQKRQPDPEELEKKQEEQKKRGRKRLGMLAKLKGLTDDERRAIIEERTGKKSSKELTLSELIQIVTYFQENDAAKLKELATKQLNCPAGAPATNQANRAALQTM